MGRCKKCESARVVAWQQTNKDKYNAYQRVFKGGGSRPKAVAQDAKAKARAYRGQRRIKEKNQVCTCCPASDIRDFYSRTPMGYQVDHVIPLSKGGVHCVKNFQYLTALDNKRKAAKVA